MVLITKLTLAIFWVCYGRFGAPVVAEGYRRKWVPHGAFPHCTGMSGILVFIRNKSGPFQVLAQKLEMVTQAIHLTYALCLGRPNANKSPVYTYCPGLMTERTSFNSQNWF